MSLLSEQASSLAIPAYRYGTKDTSELSHAHRCQQIRRPSLMSQWMQIAAVPRGQNLPLTDVSVEKRVLLDKSP